MCGIIQYPLTERIRINIKLLIAYYEGINNTRKIRKEFIVSLIIRYS